MAAPRNKFTEEQIESLRCSRYVRGISEDSVYFTDEFKRLCWQMYSEENLMPMEILRRLGVDYRILGQPRVRGFFYGLRKRHGCGNEIIGNKDMEQRERSAKKRGAEQKLELLRAENEYLKQELEFVKKIAAAGGEVRR